MFLSLAQPRQVPEAALRALEREALSAPEIAPAGAEAWSALPPPGPAEALPQSPVLLQEQMVSPPPGLPEASRQWPAAAVAEEAEAQSPQGQASAAEQSFVAQEQSPQAQLQVPLQALASKASPASAQAPPVLALPRELQEQVEEQPVSLPPRGPQLLPAPSAAGSPSEHLRAWRPVTSQFLASVRPLSSGLRKRLPCRRD